MKNQKGKKMSSPGASRKDCPYGYLNLGPVTAVGASGLQNCKILNVRVKPLRSRCPAAVAIGNSGVRVV